MSIDPSAIFRFLRRNGLLLAGILAASLLLAIAYIVLSPLKYTASAQIFVNPPFERPQSVEGNLAESPLDPSALESQIIFIQSAVLLTQVANAQELIRDEEFSAGVRPNVFSKITEFFGAAPVAPKQELGAAVSVLRNALRIDRVGKSYVISISITTSNPAKSARLANAIADAFIVDRISSRSGSNYRTVRMIDPAVGPASASQPKKILALAIALAGGLILGLGIAFALEFSRPGFTSPKQIEIKLGVPVLAALEQLPRKSDPVSHVLKLRTGRFSDGIRSLRTRLWQMSRDDAPIVIHVASTLPREGKTTMAVCLAASAATAGQRAVVIDCDLRQRSLTHRLALHGQLGITDFAHDQTSLADVTHDDAKLGLSVIPAGISTCDPQHTLSSSRMRDLIAGLRKSFEFIVMDSPPLDTVFDGMLLAGLADTTLFLIKWNDTPAQLTQQALNRLRGKTEKVAVALNLFDPVRAIKFDPIAFNFTSKSYERQFFKR